MSPDLVLLATAVCLAFAAFVCVGYFHCLLLVRNRMPLVEADCFLIAAIALSAIQSFGFVVLFHHFDAETDFSYSVQWIAYATAVLTLWCVKAGILCSVSTSGLFELRPLPYREEELGWHIGARTKYASWTIMLASFILALIGNPLGWQGTCVMRV